ncbi:MAG TPA: PD-(D/E)XK nuclease-like domain-containing protein [Patescibacteria group bacterium]|nr:PD-(D/E)XK nuclease-like domain-containing protein [Patescibacteria group bacterium]
MEVKSLEIEHKVGIFTDESEEMIRYVKAWSKSSLDHVNRSMMHYFHNKNNPKPQTDSMILGSAFHCLSLTPDKFKDKFAIAPKVDRRTNAGKATWEGFITENKGKTILTEEDGARSEAMSKALLTHPDALEILSCGEPEVAMFWINKQTGLKCKGKVDYLRNDHVIVELKKTSDASYHEFQRKINEYRYHVQGAFYLDGYYEATGKYITDFYIIVQEDNAPYATAIYKLGPKSLDAGRREYEADLKRIVDYELLSEEDKWSGYPRGATVIEMPYWAMQKTLHGNNF